MKRSCDIRGESMRAASSRHPLRPPAEGQGSANETFVGVKTAVTTSPSNFPSLGR